MSAPHRPGGEERAPVARGRQPLLQARDEVAEQERAEDVHGERRPRPLPRVHRRGLCQTRTRERAHAPAREDRDQLPHAQTSLMVKTSSAPLPTRRPQAMMPRSANARRLPRTSLSARLIRVAPRGELDQPRRALLLPLDHEPPENARTPLDVPSEPRRDQAGTRRPSGGQTEWSRPAQSCSSDPPRRCRSHKRRPLPYANGPYSSPCPRNDPTPDAAAHPPPSRRHGASGPHRPRRTRIFGRHVC